MPSGVQKELPGRPYGWVWRWSHRRHKLDLKRNVSKRKPCVSAGKLCIEVTPQSKIVWISESLCIGCGICIKVILAPEYLAGNDPFRLLLATTFNLLRMCFWSLFRDFFSLQKCPFGALSIVNLPSNLEKETTHRYCANSFKLHRYGDKPLQSVYLLLTAEQCFLWHVTKTLGNGLKLNSSLAVILGSLL